MRLLTTSVLFLPDISVDEQGLDSALLSLDTGVASSSNSLPTGTAISAADLPLTITESLNAAAKQLNHLCDNAVSDAETTHGEENHEDRDEPDDAEPRGVTHDPLVSGLAQPVVQPTTTGTENSHSKEKKATERK